MAAEISPQTPLSWDVVYLVALYGVVIVVGLVLTMLLVLRLTASSRASAAEQPPPLSN